MPTVAWMNVESESVVSLSENAARHVREMLAKEKEGAVKHLRVYVEKGGCSGMQYGLVFDEKREGDEVSEESGVCVLVDSVSAKYVRGAVVDYSDDLTGGGFKITNPNASHSCGCGSSFEA